MTLIKFNQLFHISEKALDGVTLYPRIPNNELTRNKKEDYSTPRVCFSTFIEGCLQSINTSACCKDYNIYIPCEIPDSQYIPTIEQVPDQMLTGEVWVLSPVKLKYYSRLSVHARVDTCPSKGYWVGDRYIEVACFSYSVHAKSNNDCSIIVVDQELDDIGDSLEELNKSITKTKLF